MQVQSSEVGTKPTTTNIARPVSESATENEEVSTEQVVTSNTDNVTLSAEAIALSEQSAADDNGGDGNGELPERPPKKPPETETP